MNNKILLCGERGVGKSTIIERFLKESGIEARGFRTVSDNNCHLDRWKLYMFDAMDQKQEFKPEVMVAQCSETGWWSPNTHIFDTIGVKLLTFESRPDLIVMDEIGFMERDAKDFQKKVLELLRSDMPVLGVIKRNEGPNINAFLKSIFENPGIDIHKVTVENREELYGIVKNTFGR